MNMLSRFWGRRERQSEPSAPRGVRLYAVGDIHGHAALLDAMLGAIEEDIAARAGARAILIFLGDYIDRGPDSAAVVERLRTLSGPFQPLFIAGNHEEVLLRILEGEDGLVQDWLRFGGAECAASYGLAPAKLRAMAPRSAAARVRSAVPAAHRQFLRGLADSFTAGDYLFVHAGIRPGIALEEQTLKDLRWIRVPFLDHDEPHAKVVVHGHSITDEVEFRAGRIGVDTGAYRSGLLSAVVLEGTERRVLQVGERG